MIKKVAGSEFQVTKRTIAATKLQDEDALVSIRPIRDVQDVVLMTENGFVLRFPAEEVSEKKKGAVGVRGMKLQKNDSVEEVYLFEPFETGEKRWNRNTNEKVGRSYGNGRN